MPHTPLLDALAKVFAERGYELEHLMGRILESRLDQLGAAANASILAVTRQFSRA